MLPLKKIALVLVITALSFSFVNQVALAATAPTPTSICHASGQAVPCNQIGGNLDGLIVIAGIIIFLWILFGIITILATVFWIMMIVHAATHDIPDKAVWILIMVFTHVLGAIIYYFTVKRKFSKNNITTPPQ